MKTTGGLLLLLASLLLASCGGGGGGGSSAPTERGQLRAVSSRGTTTAATLTPAISPAMPGYTASYDVACQQLTYGTADTDGRLIDASALVCIPQKTGGASSPILSYDHGTIFADEEAPSTPGSFDFMANAAAGLGYITVVPDYIGFGAARGHLHPYVHAQTLAGASVDAIRALRIYLTREGIATNGKLFLAGYSEGGYAAFATQRSMEQDFPDEFTITASAPGAGPYNILQTSTDILAGSSLVSSAYTAFLLTSYDAAYNAPSRLSDYFRAPYASYAATAFDGSYYGIEIEAMFSKTTATLLNEPFLTNFRGAGETAIKARLAENNLHDTWVPQSKTLLYHGMEDEVVAYSNATDVTAHATGAPDLTLVNCDAGVGVATTHGNCGLPYLRYVIAFFGTLDPGL